jgi:hypothetical protein
VATASRPAGYTFGATPAGDQLAVYLDNSVEIPSYKTLTFTITPTTNPPSLQPITGFAAETLDENGYEIEASIGTYSMNTDVASTFIYNENLTPPRKTELVIATGDYKVGATA